MLATYADFTAAIGEINDIGHAGAVLSWDQQTYMPPKAAAARGRQLATISAIAHEKFTDAKLGDLAKRLLDKPAALSPDQRKNLEEFAYSQARATKLPTEFVREESEAASRAFEAWVAAKKANDFKAYQPHLEKMVGFAMRKADLYGYESTPYDALLEDFERGMTTARLKSIFGTLRERQSKLVERIVNSPNQPDMAFTRQRFPEKHQWDFGMIVLQDLGYDLEAGRQDKSAHPFTTSFDIEDVRITTRVHEDDLFSALMSTLHEAGHGMFEQGFRLEDRDTMLANTPSLGIHESQSRMWENVIGRSRQFWSHYLPILKAFLPHALKGVGLDTFHRAINRVERSLIRVEADEVTYNLHVILRFEIECAFVEKRLAVKDLPEAWNAKMKELLGVVPPDDARGCLQDVHWSSGTIGYFPTYALGNLYAAQFFERIEKDIPDIWQRVAKADFAPLLAWLRKHIHTVGRRKTVVELVRDVTGADPTPEPFLRYVEKKYGELYGL